MTKDDFPLPMKGSCRCGYIHYEITEAPMFSFACHCTDCKQLTSSAFSLGLAVPRSGFTVTAGEPREWSKTADSGNTSTQFTCPICSGWTHTHTTGSPDEIIIRPTTLDDNSWVRPVGQIFTRSALPWALMAVPLTWKAEFSSTVELKEVFAASDVRPQLR